MSEGSHPSSCCPTVTATADDGKPLELKMTSDPANLAPARKAIEAFCLAHGLPQQACDDMGLCFNEAMANVTRHAYGGRHDQSIVARATDDGSAVHVSIRDWGNGVNPDQLPVRPKDPMVPGGLGLMCLRQMLDDLRFEPQPDGMLVTMTINKPKSA
jgi:anti-sigma regulatory factor (Ser/Thr protein kinase)